MALFRDPKWPEPFRRLPPRDVADFTWLHWPNFDNGVYPTARRFVDDPDAAGGMALLFDGYAGPVTAGATKGPTVTFKPDELAGDGRYHCYRIGRVTVRPDGEVFSSWGSPPVARGTSISALEGRFQVCVDELAVPDGGQAGANDWDAWLSMKVQGPAHVPGSTASNAVWIDRVLLVKPQPEQGGPTMAKKTSKAVLQDSDPRIVAVNRLFAQWDHTNTPGAAVAIVEDGAVVLRRGFGMADVEAGRPITPATVFDAASLAKQFTGYAISTLIEEKRLAADDSVRKYLPEVPDFGREITIRDLLHHTSGLRDWGSGTYSNNPPRPLARTTAGILDMVTRETALDFAPGTRHTYCNTGYNLLAAVAERITRQPLGRWMSENVFRPLSMNSTQLRDDFSAPVADLASLYCSNQAGTFVKSAAGPAPIGSSSLYTSADDFAKWLIHMGSAGVGGTPALARMREPGALNDGKRVDYGFGLCLGQIQGKKTVTHAGAYGYTSSFCYVLEDKLGVVVLSNTGAAEVWGMATQIATVWLAGKETP